MKIKNLFMFIAMAAVALTGCNKDNDGDGGQTGNETFDMLLKFDISSTKADTENVESGTFTELTNGGIFFIADDANKTILRTAIIANSPAGTVTPTQIQEGFLFTDIDASAKWVYVVGNYDFLASSAPTVAKLADLENLKVGILSQTNQNNNKKFGVEDATLFGFGNIVVASTATQDKYPTYNVDREAIFDISPIIARLEIDEIEGLGQIDEFNLAGIYINNFYLEMSVVSVMDINDLIHNGILPTDYDKYLRTTTSQTNGKYLDSWYEYLFDDGDVDASGNYIGLSTIASLSHTPVNETWAYNVFANGSAVPHIILHFTDMKMKSTYGGNVNSGNLIENTVTGTYGEKYLTITGYNKAGTDVDQPILGGNVYKLANIIFDEDDLDDYPYEEKDDKSAVYVEVTVTPWNVIPVDWK
ncbi:MAG: hypothetical protein LUH10_08060 [Tannerellaceae bacterium]|nr:hypothetical protein [Tannerellaceae bacterium]